MSLTTDPSDPRLGHGTDDAPVPQNEVYLVLSEEERAKGYVRPLRSAYRHVGPPGPRFELVDLTPEQLECYGHRGYVKFEPYPEDEHPTMGRFWTQEQLDRVGGGCGAETRMGHVLSETHACNPGFYGATYCVRCRMHRPLREFVWVADGTRVGS